MKVWKKLLIIYLVFVFIKTVLSYFILAPSAFSDNYIYIKMARSFFYFSNFAVQGILEHHYLPLYPVLLSISYLFKDMQIVYFFMKFINVIISSLIVFPSYLLAREFLKRKQAFIVSVLIMLLPANFSFSYYIMPENLFYVLFLFTVYFMYKSFTSKSYVWDILLGIFLGLSYLTKISSLILVPVVLIVLLLKLVKKDYRELIKKFVVFFVFFLTILGWLIRKDILFNFTISKFLGTYSSEVTLVSNYTFLSFVGWVFLYIGFLILASGIILPILSINMLKRIFKDKNLVIYGLISFLSIIFVVLIAVNHNLSIIKYETLFSFLTGRPLGRYVDVLLPLILINGFIGFNFLKKDIKVFKISLIVSAFILLFTAQLVFFPLFPVNNMSLTLFGVMKYVLEFLVYGKTSFSSIFTIVSLIFFSILFFILPLFFFNKKLQKKKIIIIFLILFLLATNILNFGITYYNSKVNWYENEQMQLGLWINDNIGLGHKFLIDERDCVKKLDKSTFNGLCEFSNQTSIIGFWLNNEIRIDNVNDFEDYDYIISTHILDFYIMRQTDGINLYRVGD